MTSSNCISNKVSLPGKVIWLTGLSGAGKTTIAKALHQHLSLKEIASAILDGDQLRTILNRDLDFSVEGRYENIRRIAEMARLIADNGSIAICATISPSRSMRYLAEQIIGSSRFIEVYINTPLRICEDRDVKGLYAKARTGELKEFTGITAPYESPIQPALCFDTSSYPLLDIVSSLVQYVQAEHHYSFS